MSISSEIRRAGPFTGNGSTVNFPFFFKVFTTAQVYVVRTINGFETVLALTTHYTVTLNPDQDANPGGMVTLNIAPLDGHLITITSAVPNLQPTVLANLGGFYPEIINDSLDRATIQIQQLDERLDRAFVLSLSSTGINPTLPSPRSNDLIGWDEAGTGLRNYSSTLVGANTYRYVYRAVATAGQTVFMLPAPYVVNANAIELFVNGLRLELGTGFDWIESSPTTVTLNSGLAAGDQLTFVINILAEVVTVQPSYMYIHRVTALAGQTVFHLPNPYNLNANALEVYVNGLRVEQGAGLDWVETTTTSFTFNNGLTVGDQVTVIVNVEAETLPIAAFPASSVSHFGAALVDDADAAAARITLGISLFGSSLIDDADAAAARATLGSVIGVNVQAFDPTLTALAGLATGANRLAYSTGTDTFAETNFTSFARTLLDDADAATARATLGSVIGVNVQAFDPTLAALAGLATGADKLAYSTGTDTFAETTFTSFARTLLDDADAATARATLGSVIGTNVQAFDPTLAALATLATGADRLAYSTGTDTFAETAFTSFARTLLDDADAATARATLGSVIGTNVQAFDPTLAALANLATGADRLAYSTGTDTFAETAFTSFARTLLDDADAATARTTLGVVIGTQVQAYDATLAALAGLATGANKLAYSTGTDTFSQTDLTAFARTLLDDADAATARTTLGLGASDAPQFGSLQIGHASDTTVTRSAAGVIAVEGVDVVTTTATQTLTNKTLSGPAITDGTNIPLGTTTGTQIGTATNQKLAFFGSTPIVQPAGTGEVLGVVAGSGSAIYADATFTGDVGSTAYTISDIVKALKNLGFLAA